MTLSGSVAPALRRQTVAAGFIRGMIAGMVRQGLEPALLLLAVGIAPESLALAHTRVSLAQCEALYNQIVAALQDEGFGLFSQPLRPGCFEFWCRGLVSAKNLQEASLRAGRFLQVVLPDLSLSLHTQGDWAQWIIREQRPLASDAHDPARIFAFEWLLRHLHGLCCWLVGRGIFLEQVLFPYPRPSHANDYALLYTERSLFWGEALVASFPVNLLELPIRRDENALNTFLQGAPGKLTSLYRRDREIVRRVRDLLQASFPTLRSLEDVADQLHFSPRTLHRRLDEEGASFRVIKESLRRDIAIARLTKTELSIAAIATELGYADPSTFYRAFIEWTGQAPSEYRKGLA